MYCNKCGNEIDDKSEFCSKCGNKINKTSKTEQKNKKEMSKGMSIFIIVLLSIIILPVLISFIINNASIIKTISEGNIGFCIGMGVWLIIILLCIYGIRKNILKLMGKDKKYTTEQLQKRKKRNIVLGICGTVVISCMVFVAQYYDKNYDKYVDTNNKEQLIIKIKEYENDGYIELSDKEYQEIEAYDTYEIKQILNRIENNIKSQKEYNEKYSAELDEIFNKEIKVNTYPGYDTNYTYMPANLKTGEDYTKAQIDYVTINKYSNEIDEIYYHVEMYLTIKNKYNNRTVSQGTTKRYYKFTSPSDMQDVVIINNYNDHAIQEEIADNIGGKINNIVVKPSKNHNYKYDFLNTPNYSSSTSSSSNSRPFKKDNSNVEINKVFLGVELVTVMDNARNSSNEKNVEIELKMLTTDATITMESLYNNGIEKFTNLFATQKFKCIDITENAKTKEIEKIVFQEIE